MYRKEGLSSIFAVKNTPSTTAKKAVNAIDKSNTILTRISPNMEINPTKIIHKQPLDFFFVFNLFN